MKLRISQYGWTEDRVWAVFILLLATLYTAGYTYSLRFKRGWLANIGKTNIVTALVMSVGLILLLSPLADARRIAVHSQMGRLMSGEIAADKFDYSYLRWHAGRYGQDTLNKMAGGIEHKDKAIITAKAQQAITQKNRYDFTAVAQVAEKSTPEQARKRLLILPQGVVLDDALIDVMLASDRSEQRRCMTAYAQCYVWLIDLNNDGLEEAIVITGPGMYSAKALFYKQVAKGQYKYGGTINLRQVQHTKLLSDIRLGYVKTLAPNYNDLEIGGQRITVIAE